VTGRRAQVVIKADTRPKHWKVGPWAQSLAAALFPTAPRRVNGRGEEAKRRRGEEGRLGDW
jgi:hypothetical protein